MVPPNARTSLVPTRLVARCLFLVACLAVAQVRAADDCGLLWRVKPPDAAASHLYGTIHSEDPRVLTLGDPVEQAFSGADTYVMELIPDFGATKSVMKAMYFQDQRNLKGVLDAGLYRQAVDALAKRGVGEGLAIKMQPWAVAVTLSFPQPKSGLFLDLMLYNRALQDGKRAIGLEDAGEQLAFFEGLSMEEQITLLRATLEGSEDLEETMNQLIEAYLSRDPETLRKLDSEYMGELPDDLASRFRREAIVDRNRRMAERLAPELARGNAFIAVGALHLYGEEGLVSLLRRQGNQVECVY